MVILILELMLILELDSLEDEWGWGLSIPLPVLTFFFSVIYNGGGKPVETHTIGIVILRSN